MRVIACILFNMVVFLNGSYCLQYYVGIQEKRHNAIVTNELNVHFCLVLGNETSEMRRVTISGSA